MLLEFHVNNRNGKPYEIVKVVGNTAALGSWHLDHALEMTKDSADANIWHASFQLPTLASFNVRYRYLCCRYLYNEKNERQTIVTKWETHFEPRKYNWTNLKSTVVDDFGIVDKRIKVGDGWLTCQTEIRLNLTDFDNVNFWNKRLNDIPCSIFVTPLDFSLTYARRLNVFEDEPEPVQENSLPNHTECLISVITKDEFVKYDEQPQLGRTFYKNDYFSFKVQTLKTTTLGFRFEFYVNTSPAGVEAKLKKVGFCFINPICGDTFGRRQVTILSVESHPIGQMSSQLAPKGMHRSYTKYWRKRQSLNVGHRGMGGSYKETAAVRENTIGSLVIAASHGADYVEFDVQLSKDLVPVLFHDFHICLAVQKVTTKDEYLLYEVNVDKLTLSDLRKLKVFYEKETSVVDEKTLNIAKDERNKAFPTLGEVFAAVDVNVGFNIEIKYPMCKKDGVWECDSHIDHNIYVDTILKEIFTHIGEHRRIVMSTFEPYICTMLKLKQNKYPVMFLTQGDTNRYPPYADRVTSTSEMAVSFAASNNMLGVSFHSEELLKNIAAYNRAVKRKLVSFVWGDDLRNADHVRYFKKLGFQGVIVDKVSEYVAAKRNIFLIEKEAVSPELVDIENVIPGTPSTGTEIKKAATAEEIKAKE